MTELDRNAFTTYNNADLSFQERFRLEDRAFKFHFMFSGINIVIIFTAAKPRRKGMVIMMELQLQPLAAEGNGLLARNPDRGLRLELYMGEEIACDVFTVSRMANPAAHIERVIEKALPAARRSRSRSHRFIFT